MYYELLVTLKLQSGKHTCEHMVYGYMALFMSDIVPTFEITFISL